ncbi:MAG: VCBS repeat-containing protein [Bacteroidota bacterium]
MNWIKRNKWSVLVIIVIAVDAYLFVPWHKAPKNGIHFIPATKKQVEQGKALAAQYCQSCHMLPDPQLLTREMWATGVLPRMGPFLGYTSFHGKTYFRANDVDLSFFPAKRVMDSVKWQRINDYFTTVAPDKLTAQAKTVQIIRQMPFFEIDTPSFKTLYSKMAIASYVKIDTTVNPHRLIVNDGAASRFILLDKNLQVLNAFNTKGVVVDLCLQKDGILACSIGKTMEANNLANGNVTRISIDSKGNVKADAQPLFGKLARPVKVTAADLNGDGKTDYILSEFGNLVGKLSWVENKGNGKYISHILRQRPGALTTIVQDVNHDGKPDIWAQFAQGEEGIFLYTNKGNGEFDEREVLRFPPVYGSTSFDVVDMNHDGYPDIIYTCGDNGDYTQILKPYHGVYIYINDGKNNFKQQYFYPINGCYKAIARDFDGDGNMDIATISFFPAAAQPEEAFVFFKGKGGLNFQPYAMLAGTRFQKGLTMDAGDLDGDGKPDLVLGNGYFSSDTVSKYTEPLFIVLKNRTAGIKY